MSNIEFTDEELERYEKLCREEHNVAHVALVLMRKLDAVRDYAEYRKANSSCCRAILDLLRGDSSK